MAMTLEDAIKHCEEKACGDGQCEREHRQLAKWLKELQRLKSLPAGLDEAAIRYAKLKEVPGEEERYYNQTGCNIYDAFRAGAEWRDKQIQKLSSELCDAAKEYSKHLTTGELNPYIREQMGFKAGAEWMAGQGVTIERIVDDFGNGASIKPPTEMDLDSIEATLGDKVIVQIRKK